MSMRTHTGVVPLPTKAIPVTEEQRRTVFMMAALLLDYPSQGFEEKLSVVSSQLEVLPPALAELINSFVVRASLMGTKELQKHYVETFDQRRRCSLFLSYYAVGDTRQRGAALLAFKEALATLGFFLEREELPDHLCVVLEAAAQSEGNAHDTATTMIAAHRDGVEVLKAALGDSPYSTVVEAVCAALPPIDEQTRQNFVDLIRQGPPAELVGINTPLPFPSAQPHLT